MVTVDDIAAAFLARCNALSAFTTAIPGKAWFDRPDENAAVPFAVFGIERRGEPEFESDGSYLQEYVVRLGVYTDQGVDNPQTVQLGVAAVNNAPTTWTALRDGRVLHSLPQGYDGEFAPVLRQGRDVFVSGAQWLLLIEGDLEA